MPIILHAPPTCDLTEAEMTRWRAIPTAVTVDLVREAGQIDPAIRPLRPAGLQPRLFGQAVTVRCEAPDFGAVLQALDVILRGQVLVIDAGGYRDAAMIGDILSGHLRAKGVVGVVCDGAVRDTGTLGGWDDFAVYSRWIDPRGPSGGELGAINVPVKIGGACVAPGDLVIGDDDGLVSLTLYNLSGKGRIAPGYDADFAIADPDGATTVAHADFPSHSDYSPYEGQRFRGAITHTILRGKILSQNGVLSPEFETAPHGQYLFRAT